MYRQRFLFVALNLATSLEASSSEADLVLPAQFLLAFLKSFPRCGADREAGGRENCTDGAGAG